MAVDMFIKIGSIKGESQDKTHKGEFDVLEWSWGVSNSGSAQQGSGQGAGKVNVQDLTFTKYIDKGTPDLLLACCSGKHIDQAQLTVRKAGGESPVEYMLITMQNLIITNVQTGGKADQDRLTETVSLNFQKVKVQYKEQTETGGIGDKPEMGWDVAANAKM